MIIIIIRKKIAAKTKTLANAAEFT